MTPTGAMFRDEDGKRLADFKRLKGEQARLGEVGSSITTERF